MQKKNRKGFTLIELLAVIVILAIIALIAVPVIMNVITKARKSAFEDSAYGIVKAGEMYYTNALLDAEGMTEDQEFIVVNGVFKNTKSTDTLEISGSIPSSGKVTVTKEGKMAIVLSNGEYCIQKSTNESKVKAVKQESCTDYKRKANPIFTTSDKNVSIPACITDNTPCDVTSAGDDGIGVAVKVNNSQTYDFYVMSEDTDKGTITLIINQDLGKSAWVNKEDYLEAGGIDWDGYNEETGINFKTSKGPITVLKTLEEKTSSWTNIPLETYTLTSNDNEYSPITKIVRARLITLSEASTLSRYGWAIENISGLTNDVGYWTSDSVGQGGLGAKYVYYFSVSDDWGVTATSVDTLLGVRPVITISKTVL